ncbi:uncharacterized protein UV8b_06725 [Ustilaginoidea virens]|uniref:Rhodopsin domain-containing protein n=1 Tax=Ustilaginoidea virens TaxID=1159556 RepID=A0A8E5HWF4_USTVR|nr:uncharacterized protein UV8b_06725 [Ustilaginoidea virens]QUC22484.1 hypothetical protein UV8b_06725 [Ustilaginoidea virens]
MSSDDKSQLPGLPGYDKDNLQPWLVAVTVSMTVLALAAVGLRLLSRRMKRQSLWLDDKMIIFSMVWNLAVIGFIFAMYSSGMGIHADKVETSSIIMMAKWLVVAEILYAWNLGWTKISLLLMYYRIFRHAYFKKMAWVVGIFVWAWVICITFLFIFICVPVQKLWYPQIPGRCINQVGTWISNALSTILTDLIILLLPLPQIWKLQLRKTEKMGLTLAFSLGFFVVFASAYRTSVLFTYTNTDPTYTLAPTVGWTVIEMSAGIISACLPTFLPIVLCCARACGLGRAPSMPIQDSNAPPTFGGSGNKGNKNGVISFNSFASRTEDHDSEKATDGPFYRLQDIRETESVASRPVGSEAETHTGPLEQPPLRPDVEGYVRSVHTYTVKGNESSEDDIPLQGIRVQKDFQTGTLRQG